MSLISRPRPISRKNLSTVSGLPFPWLTTNAKQIHMYISYLHQKKKKKKILGSIHTNNSTNFMEFIRYWNYCKATKHFSNEFKSSLIAKPAMKKIWVCCHVQVYVQLFDAFIYISMPAWIFSFLIHTWAHHFWVFCDGCFYFLVVFARPCSLFASFSSLFCLVLASAAFASMIANHSPQEWWVSKLHLNGCRL